MQSSDLAAPRLVLAAEGRQALCPEHLLRPKGGESRPIKHGPVYLGQLATSMSPASRDADRVRSDSVLTAHSHLVLSSPADEASQPDVSKSSEPFAFTVDGIGTAPCEVEADILAHQMWLSTLTLAHGRQGSKCQRCCQPPLRLSAKRSGRGRRMCCRDLLKNDGRDALITCLQRHNRLNAASRLLHFSWHLLWDLGRGPLHVPWDRRGRAAGPPQQLHLNLATSAPLNPCPTSHSRGDESRGPGTAALKAQLCSPVQPRESLEVLQKQKTRPETSARVSYFISRFHKQAPKKQVFPQILYMSAVSSRAERQ